MSHNGEKTKAEQIQEVLDKMILAAMDEIPAWANDQEVLTLTMLAGMNVIARGFCVALDHPSADEFRSRVRNFLDSRNPRVEGGILCCASQRRAGRRLRRARGSRPHRTLPAARFPP